MKANEKVWTVFTAAAFIGLVCLTTCDGEADASVPSGDAIDADRVRERLAERAEIPTIREPELDALGNVILPGRPEYLLIYLPSEGAAILDLNSARTGEVAERIAAEAGPRCLESLKRSRPRAWDGQPFSVVCLGRPTEIGEPVAPPSPYFVPPPPLPEE